MSDIISITIQHTFSYDNTETLLENLQKLLVEKYQLNEEKFLTYWTNEGAEILNSTWNENYIKYLRSGTDERITEINQTEAQETSETSTDDALKQLWNEHSFNTYDSYWQHYSDIFLNYYIKEIEYYTEKLLDDSVSVSEADTEATYDWSLSEEFQELKLLGLPTAFGKAKIRKNRTICVAKETEEPEELNDMEDTCNITTDDATAPRKSTDLKPSAERSKNKLFKQKPKQKPMIMPAIVSEDKSLRKYWKSRFLLFSRFDYGIRLDREGWFSVTPEKVAKHMATRLACNIIVDGFCGCGGNTIQFAKTCDKVIAIDNDVERLSMAKHNAAIYGVSDKIEFILGDFFQICKSGKLKADVVFISSPWGGPSYAQKDSYDIEEDLQPFGATVVMGAARQVTENIVLFLPRNSRIEQISRLAGNGNHFEIEHNYLGSRLVGLTAIYGNEIINL